MRAQRPSRPAHLVERLSNSTAESSRCPSLEPANAERVRWRFRGDGRSILTLKNDTNSAGSCDKAAAFCSGFPSDRELASSGAESGFGSKLPVVGGGMKLVGFLAKRALVRHDVCPPTRREGAGMMERANLVGAVVAYWIYSVSILVFVLRLVQLPKLGHLIGVGVLLAAFPLGFLVFKGPSLGRSTLYYIQIGLMLAWLAVEFLLDWWPGVEFRQTRSMVILYVTLFFAGAGGMIGVASLAGRGWTILAVILFLVMGILAFVQRAITGM